MDNFESICRSRGLDVPKIVLNDLLIRNLATLVLNDASYAVPVFASFKSIALPIASEWILGCASSAELDVVFCRMSVLAPLLPFLQPLMEHLLMMQLGSAQPLSIAEPEVLQGFISLLLHNSTRFSRYIRAEDLLHVARSATELHVRTLALAAMALVMEVSEHEFDKWVANYCGNSEESTRFEFEVIFEHAKTSVEDARLVAASSSALDQVDDILSYDFIANFENALVANVDGIFVPRLGNSAASSATITGLNSFIATDTSRSNLRRAAFSLLSDKPVLLVGEHGSGKSTIVEYLHNRVRGGDLVRIHLGDQTDAKSLVGTYTTGKTPGTFEWTAGALTSAVQNGSWVLIEDIDRAPSEIVAVLLSLLTSRELVIPSRNQVIRASPGFQILATTSVVASNKAEAGIEVIGSRNWVPVMFEPPSTTDLEVLAKTIKPFLTPIAASMLVTTFRRVEDWQEKHRSTRLVSTRDLVKLVNRIGVKYNTDDIFREAVSCFTSFLPDPWPLVHVIGDSMSVPLSQVEPLLNRHQPSISWSDHRLVIGRAEIEKRAVTGSAARNMDADLTTSKFALTQPTLRLLEEIGTAVQHMEPVLLVGETGTGKTAVVQHLAKLSRRKLVVINVSQQVETGDLVGGFKPVDARQLSGPLLEEFSELFDATFSRAKNYQFVDVLDRMVSKRQWANVIKLLREAVKMAGSRHASPQPSSNKRVRKQETSTITDWHQFALQIDAFEERLKSVQNAAQFQFIEGLLVRAIRQGAWVLLDELNLAPADTIEGIGELLSSRQLTLLESGGQVVQAHPAFRLFANMNPATDVGKRDLPAAVRSQFSEIWSPSPETDQEALRAIVSRYLPTGLDSGVINDVAQLYIEARKLAASHELVDGAGQRPHFSIRTLSRALTTATTISKTYGLRRALYEAFCMCFLTLLDEGSAEKLNKLVETHLLSKLPNRLSALSQIPSVPAEGRYVQFNHWWMPCGTGDVQDAHDYIITDSVGRNLLNLVRASSTKMFPVLIQGPTSSGKTSMISYLAKRTGHSVVRINNHEHTDLAEYLGGYESDADGRLVFKEGALVKALKQGHWLVLDELNLAPTDVLEALNRLLDDNRELLVPETQEIVRPHPDFVLFATQNPPGLYAGRKVLSRAFRNRFLELHFGDIPESELEVILRERSGIAPSYAAKIVEVHRELARQRIQRVFEHAATLRDLFRWARRSAVGYEELAFNGYALLGERSRSKQERDGIRKVIEKVMRVEINTDVARLASPEIMNAAPADIVWTGAMRRVLALVEMALSQNEPVLLVGETGCGKTTIVQAIAAARQQRLITLNAHQNTETGDLVGSQRPVRAARSSKLFEWVDGPLVVALREGSMFLLDEISLADDSVLERLNSVLESERTLFVPEIGIVEAQGSFQFLSTMNPGGDYGKKELSPALRNRFTEIWCPAVDDLDDLRMITKNLIKGASDDTVVDTATNAIVEFSQWFTKEFGLVSLRDILSWVQFINRVGIDEKSLAHGACMVFVDGLGIKAQLMSNATAITRARKRCLNKLAQILGKNAVADIDLAHVEFSEDLSRLNVGGFDLYRTESGRESSATTSSFSLKAPTSALNAMRVVRAMQVQKPVLLEGSPGAGKTSLIAALAQLSGHRLTRVNLSDQTDLADLFGQDIPLEEPGKFGWRSAPFLRAMQEGEWVLLDEMNLAPQPVLEGLNACLDHRGEAYIPELDRTFQKHPNFTVFAAQNPQGQGGGRKGLPKSFINRFSVVYVDQLGLKDLHAIVETTHPQISVITREKLVTFIEELANWLTSRVVTGGPFEFNIRDTLRWLDLIASDVNAHGQILEIPQKFLHLVVLQRFRTQADRQAVSEMFIKYFPELDVELINPVSISPTSTNIGSAKLERTWFKWRVNDTLSVLPGQLDVLETGARCVSRAWPLILVGSSGSGKTSVIRLLAQLAGAKLREFAMTPDVDSTDLLGEFDQLEKESELQRLWSCIEDHIQDALRVEDAILIDAVRDRNLEAVMQLVCEEGHGAVIHKAIASFQARDFSKPVFHWVDGMLVKAVMNGDWLVLDNANLCSAAVLDRLNSLLERDGSLIINECAEADGSPRVIQPHPNFRLFLTVNPRHGELSRAMRNRGVEVWLMPESSNYDEQCRQGLTVGGALPLRFSRPLTLSRLADIKSKSWLKSVVLKTGSISAASARYLGAVDSDLAQFYSAAVETKSITELYAKWCTNVLQSRLQEAMKILSNRNLLELSALRRQRDSVECEFDVYGIIDAAIPLIQEDGNQELGSMMLDLADVKDPSRIPVFRDWLIEYGTDRQYTDFTKFVQLALGKQYDFSQGGLGMTRVWENYGRPLGYSDAASHAEYLKAAELAERFDSMVQHIDLKFAESVADIRELLAFVSQIDDPLIAAVQQFETTLNESAAGSSGTNNSRILTEAFRNLWSSLALEYSIHPTASLRASLIKLTSFAELRTADLRSLFAKQHLSVPEVLIPASLEGTIFEILQATSQGQARDEIVEYTKTLASQSKYIVESMDPHQAVGQIVSRSAQQILEVIPEASSLVDNFDQLLNVDPRNSSQAAVTLAQCLLYLYVCPLPLDPAIAQHVWYERFLRLQEEFAMDEDCWDELKLVLGSRSSEVEKFVESRVLQQESVPSIYRPKESAIGIVHRDMVAASQLALRALRPMKSTDEIDVVLRNADHLSSRLARATGYKDLVAAVRAALSLLKLGMSLQAREKSYGKSETSDVAILRDDSLAASNLWLLNPTVVGAAAPVTVNHPLLVLQSMEHCLNLPVDELQELLMDVYRRWTLERLKVEERQREQTAGFRYDNDDDEDTVAEREFHNLFPDYDEVPELPHREDEFVPELVGHYVNLLAGHASQECSSSFVDTLVNAAEKLTQAVGASSALHLPVLYLALQKRTTQSLYSPNASSINFYTDHSLEESTEGVRFAEKVLRSIAPMLEKWPEHDTLQTLERVSSDVIALPPQAPVALHLSKLEQTHHYLYEWDRFATKEFKVSGLMADASALVVRWRRLELATWPALFTVEKRRASNAAAPFWFHLFETLISSPKMDDIGSVVKVLVIFMAESPIGQYERRLVLLEAFKNHLGLMGNTKIQTCVANVHRFYSQYVPQVKNTITELEKQLRKQVDEVVKLASWRDVNIHALKQSAQRSHRQLFKVVKKYRSMLETKAHAESDIVVSAATAVVPDLVINKFTVEEWSDKWLTPLAAQPELQQRPKHLQEITKTRTLMESYVRKVISEGTDMLDEANLYALAADVEKRAKHLRDETPKTWSKENKKTISALRVEKQQLLTETLRELKKSGLRQAVSKSTVANQVELTRVLAVAPVIKPSQSIIYDDAAFFKMIEILPRLRSAVSEASSSGNTSDVPQTDLQRGLAFTENAFSHILRLRRVAAKHYSAPESDWQQQFANNLLEMAKSPVEITLEYNSARSAVTSCAHIVKNIEQVVTSSLSECPANSANAHTEKEMKQLATLANSSTLISDLRIRSADTKSWFVRVESAIRSILNKVESSPNSGLIVPLIIELSTIVRNYASSLQKVTETDASTATVESSLIAACQPILVIIQQVVKLLQMDADRNADEMADDSDADISDEKEWLTESLALCEKLLLTLRSADTWKRFTTASSSILKLDASHKDIASAYSANLLVFVNSYRDLTHAVEQLFLHMMSTMTTGTLKLAGLLFTLASEGFCSPQPLNDDDDDDEEAKGDGVGLGDGQGGQSSSKDVDEEDDDVAEAMQTSNPEQQERDEAEDDKEDNAKEMEGDMAGETQDLPPQDDDEDNEDDGNEEEEQDDMDEEIGDLDELDPNAVDDKMWDDQQEDPKEKEKQTDQNVKGDKDEDAQAGDDNENPEPQEGQTGEGNDEEEKPEQEAADGDENDEEAEDSSGEEADDDNVNQANKNDLEENVEQKDALDLPDDMNLDKEDEAEVSNDEDEGDDQGDGMNDEDNDEDEQESANPEDLLDQPEGAAADEANSNEDDKDAEEGEEDEKMEIDEGEAEENKNDEDDAEEEEEEEDFDAPEGEDNNGENADENEMDSDNEGGAEGAGADVEGVQGPNESNDPQNEDQSTTTEQKTASMGQGATEDAATEQENMSTGGASGGQDQSQQQPQEEQDAAANERNETVRESLKQLGDAMKEFHRRQKAIQEKDLNREDEDESAAERASDPNDELNGNEDLEHVGAEDKFDTQALGKSTSEQERQDIDENMAIDDDADKADGEEKEAAGDEDEAADKGAGVAGEAMSDGEDSADEDEEDQLHQPTMNAESAQRDDYDEDGEIIDRGETAEDINKDGGSDENDLWHLYESKTHDLALVLGEQLRLILEPTVASKLCGDYRTGKRLNMKRIIPYIASEFRKDKIWLRRTKPAKREYQIMLALDDSKSMGEPAVVDLAFQAIALVGNALNSIEAGQIGIAKFGSTTEIVHPLDMPFTPQTGNEVFKQFGFNQQRTNVHQLLEKSLDMFAQHSTSEEQWKLEVIVSDGITDDHAGLRTLVRRAYDERVMLVFVVLDALNKDTSILDMNEVRYSSDGNGNPKLEVAKYMEEFPFDYYVIVQNIDDLPMVLASVLRQYFQAADF